MTLLALLHAAQMAEAYIRDRDGEAARFYADIYAYGVLELLIEGYTEPSQITLCAATALSLRNRSNACT
jgi:hypothetical protein